MPIFTISKRAKTQHVKGEGCRIPLSLQEVFLASNRGVEVSQPPPQSYAFKMYLAPKYWISNSSSNNTTSSIIGKSVENVVDPKQQQQQQQQQHKQRSFRNMSIALKRSSVHSPAVAPTNNNKIETSKPEMVRTNSIPTNILIPNSSFKKKLPLSTLTPQQYLESLLRSRGYSVQYYDVLSTSYHNKPSPLQEASYGSYIVDVVRRNDSQTLKRLLKVGISPNACNSYGESLVHLACRRGNYQSLKTMIDMKCNVQVSDEYGRTPLHDLCWATVPSFQSAAALLDIDNRMLFMKDCRGSSPLAYTRQEHWADWIKLLESRKDEYWPKVHSSTQLNMSSLLVENPSYSQPIGELEDTMSIELATLVASGKMTVSELELLRFATIDEPNTNQSIEVTPSNKEMDDISNSSCFDEEEMNELLGTIRDIMVHNAK